jgi:hypothetical protein
VLYTLSVERHIRSFPDGETVHLVDQIFDVGCVIRYRLLEAHRPGLDSGWRARRRGRFERSGGLPKSVVVELAVSFGDSPVAFRFSWVPRVPRTRDVVRNVGARNVSAGNESILPEREGGLERNRENGSSGVEDFSKFECVSGAPLRL